MPGNSKMSIRAFQASFSKTLSSRGRIDSPKSSHMEGVRKVETNPFKDPNVPLRQSSLYEICKFVILGILVLPLRVLISVILLIMVCLVANLAALGFPLQNDHGCLRHEQPLPAWRRRILLVAVPAVRLILVCMGFWHIKIIDKRKDKSKAPNIIVGAPHLTNLDAMILFWVFPPMLSGVGDVQILRIPFIKGIGAATQGIFVDLSKSASKVACKEAIRARADPSWTGLPTLIFPEGRITNGRVLIQFKLGAFAPGKPVQPVVLRYPHRHFDPTGQSKANRAFMWAPRLLTQFANFCEVEVLDPYFPSQEEQADPILFANNVRKAMAFTLSVATTEHSYDDAALFRAAMMAHVVADFEVSEMKEKFGVEMQQMTKWLKVYQEYDQNHDGVIDRGEFERYLHSTGQKDLMYLFSFIDADRSGTIEYRELVQCLAVLSQKASTELQAQVAFRVLDHDAKGVVKLPELGNGMREYNEEAFLEEMKAKPEVLERILQPLAAAGMVDVHGGGQKPASLSANAAAALTPEPIGATTGAEQIELSARGAVAGSHV